MYEVKDKHVAQIAGKDENMLVFLLVFSVLHINKAINLTFPPLMQMRRQTVPPQKATRPRLPSNP